MYIAKDAGRDQVKSDKEYTRDELLMRQKIKQDKKDTDDTNDENNDKKIEGKKSFKVPNGALKPRKRGLVTPIVKSQDKKVKYVQK